MHNDKPTPELTECNFTLRNWYELYENWTNVTDVFEVGQTSAIETFKTTLSEMLFFCYFIFYEKVMSTQSYL